MNESPLVRDVMSTDVRTCSPEDTLEHCARIMWEVPCGAVAVVDPSGTPVSIITDRDVCMAAWTQGKRLAEIPVSSAMSHRLFTVKETEQLSTAAALMRRRGVRRLLVVSRHHELVGIVSVDDMARRASVAPVSLYDDPFSAEVVASTFAALAHAPKTH